MTPPENYKYTESHEWVELKDGTATVGITDHAQNELSDVVYVELPDVGKTVQAGEVVAVVESVKAASDIYSPISGEITEVNADLDRSPSLVNSGAFTDGWLFRLKPSAPEEADKLMTAAKYAKHVDS